MLIAGSVVAADHYKGADGLMFGVIARKADTLRATFPYCGDARRVTCIVDGDTFWLQGEDPYLGYRHAGAEPAAMRGGTREW